MYCLDYRKQTLALYFNVYSICFNFNGIDDVQVEDCLLYMDSITELRLVYARTRAQNAQRIYI